MDICLGWTTLKLQMKSGFPTKRLGFPHSLNQIIILLFQVKMSHRRAANPKNQINNSMKFAQNRKRKNLKRRLVAIPYPKVQRKHVTRTLVRSVSLHSWGVAPDYILRDSGTQCTSLFRWQKSLLSGISMEIYLSVYYVYVNRAGGIFKRIKRFVSLLSVLPKQFGPVSCAVTIAWQMCSDAMWTGDDWRADEII